MLARFAAHSLRGQGKVLHELPSIRRCPCRTGHAPLELKAFTYRGLASSPRCNLHRLPIFRREGRAYSAVHYRRTTRSQGQICKFLKSVPQVEASGQMWWLSGPRSCRPTPGSGSENIHFPAGEPTLLRRLLGIQCPSPRAGRRGPSRAGLFGCFGGLGAASQAKERPEQEREYGSILAV